MSRIKNLLSVIVCLAVLLTSLTPLTQAAPATPHISMDAALANLTNQLPPNPLATLPQSPLAQWHSLTPASPSDSSPLPFAQQDGGYLPHTTISAVASASQAAAFAAGAATANAGAALPAQANAPIISTSGAAIVASSYQASANQQSTTATTPRDSAPPTAVAQLGSQTFYNRQVRSTAPANPQPICGTGTGLKLFPGYSEWEPAGEQPPPPFMFYNQTFQFNYTGGMATLSASSGALIPFAIDDEIKLYINGQPALDIPSKTRDIQPIDISPLLSIGNNALVVQLFDLIPPKRGGSPVYLVTALGNGGDTEPPVVSNLNPYQNGSGNIAIQADVTDDTAVASVTINWDSQQSGMTNFSGATYEADIFGQSQGAHYFYITATDTCGLVRRYPTYGSYKMIVGSTKGYGNVTWSSFTHEPVNTQNGNYLFQYTDAHIDGVGIPLDLSRSYNGLSVFTSTIGIGWNFNFDMHSRAYHNRLLTGAQVTLADGRTVNFTGSSSCYTPPPGTFDTLCQEGNGLVLTTARSQISYHFDQSGLLTSETDPNGNAITFTYAGGLLQQITDTGGRQISFQYDSNGLVNQINLPAGKTLHYTHDPNGLLTSFTDGRGGTANYSYNANQQLTTITTPRGNTYVSQQYDDKWRVIEQHNDHGWQNRFSYDDASRTTTVTDAEGHATVYHYDTLGRITSVTDALNQTESYTWDASFNRTSLTNRRGQTTSYQHDNRGNLTLISDPLTHTISATYASFNKPLTVTDQNGNTTTYIYDGNQNLVEVRDALGGRTTYQYNSRGQVTRMVDARQNQNYAITYQYNADGTRQQMTTPDGTTHYSYDALGRRIGLIDPNGNSYSFTFDGNDNLTDIHGPLNAHWSWQYDANNNLVAATDAEVGTTFYIYDSAENLITITNPLNFSSSYTYGPMNELLSGTDAEGRITTYKYDALYRLTRKLMPENGSLGYTYNPTDQITDITDALGRVTHYQYDIADRLTRVVLNYQPAPAADSQTNVTTSYQLDPVGNVTALTDPNVNLTSLSYDALNRRTSTVDAMDGHTGTAYDAVGNTVTLTNTRGYTTTWQYEGMNRVSTMRDALGGATSYAYDGNGNRTDITDPLGVVTHMDYNALNYQTRKVENYLPGHPSDSQTNVTMLYTPDREGRVTGTTDPRGYLTSMSYDRAGQLTSITDPHGGGTMSFVYDHVGNTHIVTDQRGNSATMTYDGLDRITNYVERGGGQYSYAYDLVGNLTGSTKPRGYATSYAYNAVNRLITVTDATQHSDLYTYDANGNTLSHTDRNGHTATMTYDRLNRVQTMTDAENNSTGYSYDPMSNLTTLQNAKGNRYTMSYDALDRPITYSDPLTDTWSYQYNPLGKRTAEIAPDGVLTGYAYDPLYRLSSVTLNQRSGHPADNQTNVTYRYGYDASSNLASVTDPLNNVWSYQYDGLDRLSSESNPLNSAWQYGYDANGNLTHRVDANGATTNYTYNADNYLTNIAYPSSQISYGYDANHNLTAMTDQIGNSSFSYDHLDRQTSATDAHGYQLGYAYDAVGNHTAITYPDSGTVQYSYLRNDWLHTMTDPAGGVVTYTRDPLGQVTQIDNPNSTRTTQSYDAANRLTSLTTVQLGGSNKTIYAEQNTYDAVGSRTSTNYTYGWRQPSNVQRTFTNDPLRRLTADSDSDGSFSTYTYDAASNRTSLVSNRQVNGNQGPNTTTYSYNAANQLTSDLMVDAHNKQTPTTYRYDNNGNVINMETGGPPGPPVQGFNYGYDNENRLTSAQAYQGHGQGVSQSHGLTTMSYDGLGRRLAKTYTNHAAAQPTAGAAAAPADQPGTTNYVFDGMQPIAEYSIQTPQRDDYYRGDQGRITALQHFPSGTQGQWFWYAYDGLGNVTGLTKQAGQSTHNYRYDSFGVIDPGQGNFTDPHNHYTFGGQSWDDNMGMYEFYARAYDPSTGRWQQQDPYQGQISDPLSLQRYVYVEQNASNNTDWMGFTTVIFVRGINPPWVPDNQMGKDNANYWQDIVGQFKGDTPQYFCYGGTRLSPTPECKGDNRPTATPVGEAADRLNSAIQSLTDRDIILVSHSKGSNVVAAFLANYYKRSQYACGTFRISDWYSYEGATGLMQSVFGSAGLGLEYNHIDPKDFPNLKIHDYRNAGDAVASNLPLLLLGHPSLAAGASCLSPDCTIRYPQLTFDLESIILNHDVDPDKAAQRSRAAARQNIVNVFNAATGFAKSTANSISNYFKEQLLDPSTFRMDTGW